MSVLLSLMLVISGAIQTQTDWVSGPGTSGPVPSWGSAFYQSTNVNYNITGQISLVATSTPSGTWQKHIINTDGYIDGHDGLFPADFDGDGDMDLAGAVSGKGVRIFRNNLVELGSVSYSTVTTLTGIYIYGSCLLWCGDFDGDGDADIVVPSSSVVGWFENKGGFAFVYHSIGSPGGYACDVDDIDQDGDMDVVVVEPLAWWRNNGSGTPAFTRVYIAGGKWWRVKLGDLNKDGYPDLLNADNVHLYNPVAGSYPATPNWTMGRPDGSVDGIWIRDFNNDGKKDLLISDQWGTQAIYWMENVGTGASYTKHVVCPSPLGQYYGDGCVAEDIDLDGKADVVGGYSRVGFFKQVDGDNFLQNIIDYIYECHYVYAANLDYKPGGSDFDLDILVTYYGNFVWYENVSRVAYATSGNLESSIFEVADPATWEALLWNGNRTNTTTLSCYVRTGADATETQTNPWQGPFDIPVGQATGEFDISSVTTSGDRFFQYKVVMGGGGSESPVVYELAVRYSHHDVGATVIGAPTGTVDKGTTLQPTATITNYRDVTETNVPVLFTDVTTGWTTTYTVPSLAPNEVLTFTFPDNWTATDPPGNHDLTCATQLSTDLDHSNDQATGSVFIRFPDVAAVSVDVPGVPEPVGFTWYPQATIQNNGSATVTFDVTITDGLGYTSTYADLTLGPAGGGSDVQQITFPDQWIAGAAGTYTFTAETHMTDDVVPANNTATGQMEVVKCSPDLWGGATLTQGYWKNHPYYDPQHPDAPYIEKYLPVTIAGVTVSTVPEALAIFDPPKPVTAWKMFLMQFLAAKLNAGWQNNPSLLAAWYNYPGGDYPFDNQRVFDIVQVADGYRIITDKATLDAMKTALWNMNRYTEDDTRCLWDAPWPSGTGPQGVEVAAPTTKLDLTVTPSLAKSGIVRIAYSLPKAGTAELKVLDITGRTVMTRGLPTAASDNVIALDASSWSAGVYILKLASDAGNLTRKLVIE